MNISVTPDMVGRANALAPELSYEVVKAMLEAAMASLPVSLQIRDQVISDGMPDLVGEFLRHLRSRQIALVFHDGLLEGGKTGGTAEESLLKGAMYYSDLLGPGGVDRLFKETSMSLWDASSGWPSAKRVGSAKANLAIKELS